MNRLRQNGRFASLSTPGGAQEITDIPRSLRERVTALGGKVRHAGAGFAALFQDLAKCEAAFTALIGEGMRVVKHDLPGILFIEPRLTESIDEFLCQVVECEVDQMIAAHIDTIPGGKGDGKDPRSVDRAQLKAGIAVEMEHTTDPQKAMEIALDHLTEKPDYYTRLHDAGIADEPGSDPASQTEARLSFDPEEVDDWAPFGREVDKIINRSEKRVAGRAKIRAAVIARSDRKADALLKPTYKVRQVGVNPVPAIPDMSQGHQIVVSPGGLPQSRFGGSIARHVADTFGGIHTPFRPRVAGEHALKDILHFPTAELAHAARHVLSRRGWNVTPPEPISEIDKSNYNVLQSVRKGSKIYNKQAYQAKGAYLAAMIAHDQSPEAVAKSKEADDALDASINAEVAAASGHSVEDWPEFKAPVEPEPAEEPAIAPEDKARPPIGSGIPPRKKAYNPSLDEPDPVPGEEHWKPGDEADDDEAAEFLKSKGHAVTGAKLPEPAPEKPAPVAAPAAVAPPAAPPVAPEKPALTPHPDVLRLHALQNRYAHLTGATPLPPPTTAPLAVPAGPHRAPMSREEHAAHLQRLRDRLKNILSPAAPATPREPHESLLARLEKAILMAEGTDEDFSQVFKDVEQAEQAAETRSDEHSLPYAVVDCADGTFLALPAHEADERVKSNPVYKIHAVYDQGSALSDKDHDDADDASESVDPVDERVRARHLIAPRHREHVFKHVVSHRKFRVRLANRRWYARNRAKELAVNRKRTVVRKGSPPLKKLHRLLHPTR